MEEKVSRGTRMLNYYKDGLHIECGANGLPLDKVNNDVIDLAYYDKLEEIYIGFERVKEQNKEIGKKIDISLDEKEKRNNIRTKKYQISEKLRKDVKETLNKRFSELQSKDLSTKILLLKLMIQNRDMEGNPSGKDMYNFVNKAYDTLNTPEKRKVYDDFLIRKHTAINKKDTKMQFLNDYYVPLEIRRIYNEDDIFLELKPNDCIESTIPLGKREVLFLQEEYVTMAILQKDKNANEVASKDREKNRFIGRNKKEKIDRTNAFGCKYKIKKCVLLFQSEDKKWQSIEFYSGTNWIELFSELNTFKRDDLIRAVLTAIKKSYSKGDIYIGDIFIEDGKFICEYEEKLKDKIENLTNRESKKEIEDAMHQLKIIGQESPAGENKDEGGR